MSEHQHGAIWTRGPDLERLHAAPRICYLVGSYDGSGNYGDILQLHANIERLKATGSDILATPLVYWRFARDHFALHERHPRIFGESCFLLYVPDDEVAEAEQDLNDQDLAPLADPPRTDSQVVMYGGGFFNTWWGWGVHKLDLVDLLTDWLGDDPQQGEHIAIVGQQVSRDFLSGETAERFATLLDRASIIGVRDDLSFENLKRWNGLDPSANLVVSGDDATTPIAAAAERRRQANAVAKQADRNPAQPYVVNVHLSMENYVTNDPHRLLKTYESILRKARTIAGQNLTLNLLIAYDDSRISESQYVDALKASSAVNGCTINVVRCLDEFVEDFPRFGEAQLTISSSYHVAFTSLLLGIPTAFIYGNGYYWHKVEGLKRAFQIPEGMVFDTREDACDSFSNALLRVLRDEHYREQVAAGAARGAVSMSLRSTEASMAIGNFLTAGYVDRQEDRYQSTADRLIDTMEQLSDLRLEHNRLLNVATRLSTAKTAAEWAEKQNANGYQQTVQGLKAAVRQEIPQGATVLVVSKGDGELLKLDGRAGQHFPQTQSGVYAGHHPADSAAAIKHLEELRSRGAGYLAIPSPTFWWLDHYKGLRQHLDRRYRRIRGDDHSIIYQLGDVVARGQSQAAAPSAATNGSGVATEVEQAPDPIIVYGPPRSGTTYLIEILNQHPEIFISTETRVFVWAHQTLNVSTQEFYTLFKDRELFVDHLRSAYPDLIRDFYRQLKPGVRYWGDKNPHYASPDTDGCLQTILDLFPGARFINIIRDGRGTVSSVLQKGWEDFDTAHKWWTDYLDVGCTFGRRLPSKQYFELRYEDLIEDDTAMARRLFDFLDIEIHPNVLKFCDNQQKERSPINHPIRNLNNGDLTHSNWETVLEPDQQRSSLDLLGKHLVQYGYETESSVAALRSALEEQNQNQNGHGLIRSIGGNVRQNVRQAVPFLGNGNGRKEA